MAYSAEEIEERFNQICKRIEDGESLRSILKDRSMPGSETFYIWIDESTEKAKLYAQACARRADVLFDEILEIADDGTNDYMTIVKGDNEYNVEDREVTNRSKLRVEARKWVLAKMQPKKYGDKLDLTTDGDKLTFDLSKLSGEQLAQLAAIQSQISE